MKRKFVMRYLLEFVVIVMGISLSFYIEKALREHIQEYILKNA